MRHDRMSLKGDGIFQMTKCLLNMKLTVWRKGKGLRLNTAVLYIAYRILMLFIVVMFVIASISKIA